MRVFGGYRSGNRSVPFGNSLLQLHIKKLVEDRLARHFVVDKIAHFS